MRDMHQYVVYVGTLIHMRDMRQYVVYVGTLIHMRDIRGGSSMWSMLGTLPYHMRDMRQLCAKSESWARSARVSRAMPESRARCPRELRAKPKPRAKPEKKRGEGSGEGARRAPPQKIFKKSHLKPFNLVHLKQLFELTNEMV